MMSGYLPSLADHLWQSTLFAVGVWFVALALRNYRAAIRHRLWLAASLKFLIPVSALVSLGGYIPWRPDSLLPPPRLSDVVETISQPFSEAVLIAESSRGVIAPEIHEAVPSSRIPAMLAAIWFTGFIASIAWWLVRWRQVRQVAKIATPLTIDLPSLPCRLMTSPAPLEPGVFGVFKPVLLVPEGITDRLSQEQFDCVIAHEICHLRRRDNLAGAVHLFVEALFWFHPLMYWIRARMIDEQERACDEEVLSRGAEPQVYAESIIRICEFYLASRLICVSGITGSNLKKRIENIMKRQIGIRLDTARTALLMLAAVVILAGPVALGGVHVTGFPALAEVILPIAAAIPPQSVAPPVSQQVLPVQVSEILGRWDIESPAMVGPNRTPFPGRLQFMFDRSTGRSMAFDPLVFRGLSTAQIESTARTSVRFEFQTEAGTFLCDGEFALGRGSGSYVFRPDPGFISQMAALGFPAIQENELVSMALQGVGPRYLTELRSAGLSGLTFNELMGMRATGVTAEYVREVVQAGHAVTGNDVIGMFVTGVRPGGPPSTRVPLSEGRRTWSMRLLERPGGTDRSGRVQLTFSTSVAGTTSSSFIFDSSVFRGLTADLIASSITTPVRFDIIRQAGTFVCEGNFQAGSGTGTFVFQPDASFAAEMNAAGLGFRESDDRVLLYMALHDVGMRYVIELRAAGVDVSSVHQLMNLAIQQVTPGFARGMLQVFPTASANDLVKLRVQRVAPETAREIRGLYPTASVGDVINIKLRGFRAGNEFVR